MVSKIKLIFKVLHDILRGKSINFACGSITWKECFVILYSIFKGKNIVDGINIEKYEKEFCRYLGVKYSYSFGAGRMAFYAILKAMDIKDGDEVILSGYTCVVVPAAIVYCRAKPVYVDIEPDTLNIDVSKIEEKITPKTKIIYVQHTFGSFCDMESITKIAKKYNLKIIEDCAHALGAEYNGIKAGTYGDAAYFTTEQSKIISTGMGGMAITNDDEIAIGIREIQSKSEYYDEKHIKKVALQIVLFNFLFHPYIYSIGKYLLYYITKCNYVIRSTTEEEMNGKMPVKYPVKLSNIQAIVGLSQLKNINKNIEHRRRIAKLYDLYMEEFNYIIPKSNDSLYNPVYIRYWLLVGNRKEVQELFQKYRIEIGEWFNSPIHPKGSSFEKHSYQKGCCPIAEYITEHNVNLPTHMKVSEKDVSRIINILKSI